jgi:hypothetical protein
MEERRITYCKGSPLHAGEYTLEFPDLLEIFQPADVYPA